MKSTLRFWLPVLLLAIAGIGRTFAEDGAAAGAPTDPAARSSLAANLAAQVAEIASSPRISTAKKERQIATAVRVAVVAATAYKQDASEILGIAVELSSIAANAAPPYTEVIARAVLFAPSVARIDGAASRIRTAAFAAARAPKRGRQPAIPSGAVAETPEQPRTPAEVPLAQGPAGRPATVGETAPSAAAGEQPATVEMPSTSDSSTALSLLQKRSTSFYLTAQLAGRYDNNIFLSPTHKVADTIITVAPGAEFDFGENSLAHGAVVYQEAFQRYTEHNVGNASLGTGNANFAYDSGTTSVKAAAALQQLYETNVDLLGVGTRELTRSDIVGLNASVESQLSGKTSASAGADFTWTSYKTQGLIGNENTEVPVKLYFKATPKVDLSAGVTYGIDNPKGDGPNGRDLFYNVGARGSFTPKLTGEFSVGYQTRVVADNPQQRLLGFDGTLNYDIAPKTTSVLVFSRQFSTSALGESLVNSHYSFTLSNDLTPRWQIGGSVTYRDVDYGPAVFTVENQPVSTDRRDKDWEAGLFTSLSYSKWLTATANYTFRNNHSTLSIVDFSDDILSLTLTFRY
jgi:hypothetical protein